jgi:ferredoxin
MGEVSARNRIRLRVDRELCYGFADCVDTTPGVFELDDESKAVVIDPDGAALDDILTAAQNCPVDAIFVVDEGGADLYP